MVAMDRRRHRHALAARLHELEHPGLAQHVLENHPVGPQLEVAAARHQLLVRGIIQMSQEDFFRQGQRPLQAAADDFDVALHRRIDTGGHLGCGFDVAHQTLSVGSFVTPYFIRANGE
jgi:hypothetical protein